jgi:hypothetical protein
MARASRRSDLTDRTIFEQTDRLRHKYESLLDDLNEPSGDSDLANVSFTSTDSCAGVELQQWEQMWSHVVSMINEVVPVDGSPLHSWTEKRLSLIALISKLVKLAKQQKGPKPRASDARPRTPDHRPQPHVDLDQEARIAGRLRNVESRIARQLDEQHRLLGRLDGRDSDLLRIVRIRDESPARVSAPRPRKRHREKAEIRELIRTTNAIQQDYRRMSGRKHDSIETVSSLRGDG